MKKIFVRGGASPFESLTPSEVLLKNSIAGNAGNMLFLYGSLRYIVDEDSVVTPNYMRYTYSDEEMATLNEEEDCFLIPMADAFRIDFLPQLRGLTHMVERLDIPCVVSGVGIRAPLNDDCNHSFPFDTDVKNFVEAVLNKSAKIGVRGELTANYLHYLGFQKDRDYTIIGCPSMYINGPEIRIRETKILKDSFAYYGINPNSKENIYCFLNRTKKELSNCHFIPQELKELKTLFTGQPYIIDSPNPCFPKKITDFEYSDPYTRFFLNVPTWINYLKNADFYFGTRLHGNVAAILAGTPSLIIPTDARTFELAEYHHMTKLDATCVNEYTDIMDIISKADFKNVEKYQLSNFTHFIDFLSENDLNPYRPMDEESNHLPFDERMSKVSLEEPVKSLLCCSPEEIGHRFDEYYPAYEEKTQRQKIELRTKIRDSNLKLEKQQKEWEEQQTKLEKQKTELEKQQTELQEMNEKLISESEKRKRKIKKLRNEIKILKLNDVRNSYSYRIGKIITWPFRKIRDVLHE